MTAMRQKIVILPKIYDANGDIEGDWHVYFSVRDPKSGKMCRFRRNQGVRSLRTKKAKYIALEIIRLEYEQMLKNGWTPYDDDEMVIYNDHLQYKGLSDIYKTRRKSNRTLDYFTNSFLEHIKAKVSPATLSSYTSKVRTFNAFVNEAGEGDSDISAIDNKIIVSFFGFLISGRKLSGNSTKKYRQILFALFDYIIDQKALRENPVYNLPECNRINDNAARPVYPMDIKRFKSEIKEVDPQLWMAIEFEFYCYIRPGTELRFMKIKDIDFARGLIFINKGNFKTRRENIKEIPDHFLIQLRNEYNLMQYPGDYYVFGKHGKPGSLHVGKNTLRFRFNKFRKALNMPLEYKFYSWKHTGGIMAIENGVPINQISDQMGHTTLAHTSDYLKAKGGRRLEAIRNNYPKL
jgi:integrase